jgi:hypothetical protein
MYHLVGTVNMLETVKNANLLSYFTGERYNELTDTERAHIDKATDELDMAMRRMRAIARGIKKERE